MNIHMDTWICKAPVFNTTLHHDAKALAHYIQEGMAFLKQLPLKMNRNEQQQYVANQIFASCRGVRSQFMDVYAQEIYLSLTEEFKHYHRLDELTYKAAEQFPGLVPTREQINEEQKYIQAHKEGLEIDQGIFFRSLLRTPKVGLHLADAMLFPKARSLDLLENYKRSGALDLGAVFIERQGRAAYLTINNQHCLNAEDNRLIDDLETAVDLVLLDDDINVGILRGGVMTHPRYLDQRVFCAGINLSALHGGKISFVNFLLGRELGYISKITHGLLSNNTKGNLSARTIQKPWVGAVDAFAIGGGMQLLLVLDKIIAAENAYFVLPAAQEGIIPGAANFRLSRMFGSRLARQVILSGKKILASEPEAQWLCDQIVPVAAMDNAIQAAVKELDNPAVIENRRMLNFAEEPRAQFCDYMAEFSYIQAMRLYSSDVLAKISRWARVSKEAHNVLGSC